ncbi:MAG: exodeoxyribonuclease III [Oscillospiraceae bacterium]
MKFISWNVNGFRAVLGKGFAEAFAGLDADIFCIQESKMQEGQAEFAPKGYFQYWNSAVKKGYSGTAVFTRREPLSVRYGIGAPEHDTEGRAITLEFEDFYLLNVYTPNSQRELTRLAYRMEWEDILRDYIIGLNAVKPVIYCGDLNVAHNEIDLKNPKSNRGNAGFTDEERLKFTQLLQSGFTDSFRALYPEKQDAYSWWSYMRSAREKNIGWRIDYFVVSNSIAEKIDDALIYPDIFGSDHCPIGLVLKAE